MQRILSPIVQSLIKGFGTSTRFHTMTSNGILGTSVTWKDFEKELKFALRTEARLGENKSVLDIGEGNGFASCCGLITCDWVGATPEETLPASVVLKIPSTEPLRKLNDTLPAGQKLFESDNLEDLESEIEQGHNLEVATYDFLSEFSGLSIPKCFYAKAAVDEKPGHMCLEYIANSRMMNFHENHTVEQLKQIARALGKIQACSLKKEPTYPEMHKDFFAALLEQWTLEALRGAFDGIRQFDDSEKMKELLDKIGAILPRYQASKLGAAILDDMDFHRVLVNGDLHTANVLIDKDSGNLTALIDWQSTHLGIGVEDIHRIAITALTTEDRRAATPMLVEEMYDSLVKDLDGDEPPYSLEKLLILSELMFVPSALYIMSTTAAIITTVQNDIKISDEERAVRKEIMMKKVIGTLEDILEFDIKNKKHAENLLLQLS